jgi:hypothetical protein
VKKVLLGAALAALILVPAASASHSHRVKLALVALPKSALGKAGRSLALSHDNSGVVSNAERSSGAISAKPNTFSKLGRVTGYDLTYGDPYSGASGVTAILTAVDQYKTAADAKRGLAFWRKDDPKVAVLGPYGLPLTVKALKTAKVGTHRFAFVTTYKVPAATPVSLVDEQFTDGKYVLDVVVGSGSSSTVAHAAAKFARALDHRLRLAEAGHLRGKPVKLPGRPTAGPPVGGPDLATLALTTDDFGGEATIEDQGYDLPGSPSLSEYTRDMEAAGDDLTQIIDWFPTANDATIIARFEGSGLAYVFTAGGLTGVPGQFTPVDLSAVGDNAYGGIISITPTGQPTVYLAVISLSAGQAASVILVGSDIQIQSSDLANLAQIAANRLNAGLNG